jgi:hypothetical protein
MGDYQTPPYNEEFEEIILRLLNQFAEHYRQILRTNPTPTPTPTNIFNYTYKNKYLKYKNKYLQLKYELGI